MQQTPPQTIYAVGDVHGRADLLDALLDHILSQAPRDAVLVMLGDYIDRGPRSDAVLERLAAWRARPPMPARFLCGNHEDVLLKFLRDETSGPTWGDFGGRQTLAAYGVPAPPPRADQTSWRQAAAQLSQAMPAAHLDFLNGLEERVVLGGYFFAHAGVRPGVPLERQSREDLLWVRDSFLGDDRPLDKVVVHGHTPAPEPYGDARRIGVDTGAYATGVLTAVRLDGTRRRFIQARKAGSQVRVATLERAAA